MTTSKLNFRGYSKRSLFKVYVCGEIDSMIKRNWSKFSHLRRTCLSLWEDRSNNSVMMFQVKISTFQLYPLFQDNNHSWCNLLLSDLVFRLMSANEWAYAIRMKTVQNGKQNSCLKGLLYSSINLHWIFWRGEVLYVVIFILWNLSSHS